jgi:hypothetical protein
VLNGSFTLTPSKAGFNFSPAGQDITVNGASVTEVNFSSTVQTFSITGTISGAGGNGATVALSGAANMTATADANGNFTFSVVNGDYTVTPSKDGYAYTPTNRNVIVSGAAVIDTNFSSVFSPSETTPFHDDFNRSIIGGNYLLADDGSFFGPPTVDGTTFLDSANKTSVALVQSSAAMIGANQFARVKLVDFVNTDAVPSLFLRMTLRPDKKDIQSGYELDFGKLPDNSGEYFAIYYKDPTTGWQTVQDITTISVPIPADSVVEFHASGTTLQLLINGQIAWTGIHSGLTTGAPGLGGWGNAILDEFFAGNYVAD